MAPENKIKNPKDLQASLNAFVSHFKLGYPRLTVDGKVGKATHRRIMTVKWYLGYGKRDRGADVTVAFIRRLRHPKSAKYSPASMRASGGARRAARRAKLRANKLRMSASDKLWGGSRQFTNRAIPVGARYGAPVTSRKRFSALNGNTSSDHNTWNVSADAVDLGTFNGAGVAHAIAKEFGISNYSTGNYNNYYVKGKNGATYRIQILWAVSGHYNHVHVGVRKA